MTLPATLVAFRTKFPKEADQIAQTSNLDACQMLLGWIIGHNGLTWTDMQAILAGAFESKLPEVHGNPEVAAGGKA